jgi:hypothetical protein
VAAPIGNKFWMMRSTHGREPIFASPELLWSAACEYFEWVHNNPLLEEKLFHAQGIITKDSVCKMRAMTIRGMCFFIGLSRQGWQEYSEKQDFSDIVSQIEDVIYTQKLEGAAADLLNANIIARELGLADKIAQETTGVIHVNTTAMSAEEAYNLLINGGTIKTD